MSIFPYLLALTSLAIVLLNRSKVAIGLLLGQYALAFGLSLSAMPMRTLIARLVGGFFVCAILYSAETRFGESVQLRGTRSLPSSLWFRLITSLIVFVVGWAIGRNADSIPTTVNSAVYLGAVLNLCFGLLMLGLYQSPMEAAIGLLTLLIGFDLFYGGIEPSLAIVVLMISFQLIISLAISYILSNLHHGLGSGANSL